MYHPCLQRVSAHSHLFFELTYILNGTVEHTIDGRTHVLQAGNYFFVDYGSKHAYHTPDNAVFSNIDCLFLPEFLDPALKGGENLAGLFSHYLVNYNSTLLSQNPTQMVFSDPDGRVLSILKGILEEEKKREAGFREMIRCQFIQILLLTLRSLSDASIASGNKKTSPFICSYVSNHYQERISLAELALQMNYSLPYVSKCFKDEMGVTFVEYLQEYRIRKACRLLLSEKDSIPNVAEKVGYRDIKFFSALFKRIVGISPATFRKQNR